MSSLLIGDNGMQNSAAVNQQRLIEDEVSEILADGQNNDKEAPSQYVIADNEAF